MSDVEPDIKLQQSIGEAMKAAVDSMLHWDFIEAVSNPVFDYVTARLNASGADSFLLNHEGGELTVGVAVWDENGDDLLASAQCNFSDILIRSAHEDAGELELLIAATERTLAMVRAKMATEIDGSLP